MKLNNIPIIIPTIYLKETVYRNHSTSIDQNKKKFKNAIQLTMNIGSIE